MKFFNINNRQDSNNRLVTLAAGFIMLSAVFYLPFTSPYYNWDILAYTAGVLHIDEPDFNKVHERTYELMKGSLSEKDYSILFSNSYEQLAFKDPQILKRRMPSVYTRPLYIAAMYMLWKTGVNTINAGMALSVLPALLLLCLLYYWFLRYITAPRALALTFLYGIAFNIKELSRLSTPDSLNALLVIGALYILIEQKPRKWFWLASTAAVMVRFETVLLFAVGIFFFFLENRQLQERKEYQLKLFLITAALLLLSSVFFGQFLFLGSAVGNMPLMPGESYVKVFGLSARELAGSPLIGSWVLLSAALGFLCRKNEAGRKYRTIPYAVAVFMLCRFVLFPNSEIRFYISSFLILNLHYIICLIKRPESADSALKPAPDC